MFFLTSPSHFTHFHQSRLGPFLMFSFGIGSCLLLIFITLIFIFVVFWAVAYVHRLLDLHEYTGLFKVPCSNLVLQDSCPATGLPHLNLQPWALGCCQQFTIVSIMPWGTPHPSNHELRSESNQIATTLWIKVFQRGENLDKILTVLWE